MITESTISLCLIHIFWIPKQSLFPSKSVFLAYFSFILPKKGMLPKSKRSRKKISLERREIEKQLVCLPITILIITVHDQFSLELKSYLSYLLLLFAIQNKVIMRGFCDKIMHLDYDLEFVVKSKIQFYSIFMHFFNVRFWK